MANTTPKMRVQAKLVAVNDETGVQLFSDGKRLYFQTPGQAQAAGPVPLASLDSILSELGFRRVSIGEAQLLRDAPGFIQRGMAAQAAVDEIIERHESGEGGAS